MVESVKNKVAVLIGPTAVGKTAVALTLAWRLGAEIVNADSLQVYRQMDIGTAKPSAEQLASHDLIVMGQPEDNALTARLAAKLPVSLGKDFFRWQGKVFGNSDDGLFLAAPNPWKPDRTVYCFVANSGVQLWQMTRRYQPLPVWALFKGDQVIERGFLPAAHLTISFSGN